MVLHLDFPSHLSMLPKRELEIVRGRSAVTADTAAISASSHSTGWIGRPTMTLTAAMPASVAATTASAWEEPKHAGRLARPTFEERDLTAGRCLRLDQEPALPNS
jgi:hypothetical protein